VRKTKKPNRLTDGFFIDKERNSSIEKVQDGK